MLTEQLRIILQIGLTAIFAYILFAGQFKEFYNDLYKEYFKYAHNNLLIFDKNYDLIKQNITGVILLFWPLVCFTLGVGVISCFKDDMDIGDIDVSGLALITLMALLHVIAIGIVSRSFMVIISFLIINIILLIPSFLIAIILPPARFILSVIFVGITLFLGIFFGWFSMYKNIPAYNKNAHIINEYESTNNYINNEMDIMPIIRMMPATPLGS